MPIPKLVFQVRVLVKDHQRTLALQIGHEFLYAQLRRYRYAHVHMICTYKSFNQRYLLHLTELSQDFSYILPYFPIHDFPSVFGNKHHVECTIPAGMLYTFGVQFFGPSYDFNWFANPNWILS